MSPDLELIDFEAAVWVHGGYPQVPYKLAVLNLRDKVREMTPFDTIDAASIYMLDVALDRQLYPAEYAEQYKQRCARFGIAPRLRRKQG